MTLYHKSLSYKMLTFVYNVWRVENKIYIKNKFVENVASRLPMIFRRSNYKTNYTNGLEITTRIY
jgi:hypothetical protein